MSNANLSDFLTDPLSEVTRKERRNLLLASTAGVLVAKMGLIPARISVLGVEFSPPAQQAFISLMSLIVGYFILAFVFYGMADFFVWRKKYQNYLVTSKSESLIWTQEDQFNYEELHHGIPRAAWLYTMSKPVAFVRVAFEFFFPLIIGITAISLLVLKNAHP